MKAFSKGQLNIETTVTGTDKRVVYVMKDLVEDVTDEKVLKVRDAVAGLLVDPIDGMSATMFYQFS